MRGIPEAFQSRHAIRRLNIAAVGLALGCVSGAVLGHITFGNVGYSAAAFIIGVSTLCIGSFWAAFFRPQGTAIAGRRRFRIGWGTSVVLAILNAQVSCFFVMADRWREPTSHVLVRALLFAPTAGVFLWLPALLLTFLCFGAPIVRAQVLAEKGLAGEEQGERIVGIASFVMAAMGLFLSYQMPSSSLLAPLSPIRIIGYLGMLTGGMAAYAAFVREARRRTFVREVEAGNVAGFRVDPSPEGKVLVRVSSLGEGYRVADYREELVDLDASGEAKRARYCELP